MDKGLVWRALCPLAGGVSMPLQLRHDTAVCLGLDRRYSNPTKKSHIPTDLVVAQEASAVECSSRPDFLWLHNLETNFVTP